MLPALTYYCDAVWQDMAARWQHFFMLLSGITYATSLLCQRLAAYGRKLLFLGIGKIKRENKGEKWGKLKRGGRVGECAAMLPLLHCINAMQHPAAHCSTWNIFCKRHLAMRPPPLDLQKRFTTSLK
jgi:hypothetical protein